MMAIMLSFASQIQNILSIRLTRNENIELTSFKLRLECLADGNPAPTYRSQTFKTQISLFSEKQDSFLIKLDFRWFKDDDTTTVRCHTIIMMAVLVTIMKIVMNMMVPPIGDQVIK